MARRSFDVVDLTELFVHWEAGRSQVQIAQCLGLDRKTVRKYLAPAVADGLTPGGDPAGERVWVERIGRVVPGPGRYPAAAGDVGADRRPPGLHRRAAEGRRHGGHGRAAPRDDHGVSASESSVRRWIHANLAEEAARARVTVPRGPVEPGSEAQIDYGRLGRGRPGDRAAACGAGVRDGVGVFPDDVRPPGPADGPNRLVRDAMSPRSSSSTARRPAGPVTT